MNRTTPPMLFCYSCDECFGVFLLPKLDTLTWDKRCHFHLHCDVWKRRAVQIFPPLPPQLLNGLKQIRLLHVFGSKPAARSLIGSRSCRESSSNAVTVERRGEQTCRSLSAQWTTFTFSSGLLHNFTLLLNYCISVPLPSSYCLHLVHR